MPGDRRGRILARFAGPDGTKLDTARLCEACAEATAMTGAGVMLMSGATPQGSLCTTDEISQRIEQLQFELGEGPCIDAANLGRPVLEPDLAHPTTPRWLAFSGPALDAGARAVFGFPLRVGAVRVGALNLYRDAAGEPSDEQHADALVMADLAARAVLLSQGDAPTGTVAAELEAHADFQYVVHQASGMAAAQLDITVGQALLRLKAHAFGNDLTLIAVAHEIVARTLRFEPKPDGDRTRE